MRDALQRSALQIFRATTRALGVGGAVSRCKKADLFLGNAGTAFRPLTAALASRGGEYRLSGVPRMHERPIGDLVDALRGIGAQIDYTGNEGFPAAARSTRAKLRIGETAGCEATCRRSSSPRC